VPVYDVFRRKCVKSEFHGIWTRKKRNEKTHCAKQHLGRIRLTRFGDVTAYRRGRVQTDTDTWRFGPVAAISAPGEHMYACTWYLTLDRSAAVTAQYRNIFKVHFSRLVNCGVSYVYNIFVVRARNWKRGLIQNTVLRLNLEYSSFIYTYKWTFVFYYNCRRPTGRTLRKYADDVSKTLVNFSSIKLIQKILLPIWEIYVIFKYNINRLVGEM